MTVQMTMEEYQELVAAAERTNESKIGKDIEKINMYYNNGDKHRACSELEWFIQNLGINPGIVRYLRSVKII